MDDTQPTNDEHIRRLNTLIARARGVATLLYNAPRINVDNASPRDVMADIIDELVRQKRAFEAKPGIFEELTQTTKQPTRKTK